MSVAFVAPISMPYLPPSSDSSRVLPHHQYQPAIAELISNIEGALQHLVCLRKPSDGGIMCRYEITHGNTYTHKVPVAVGPYTPQVMVLVRGLFTPSFNPDTSAWERGKVRVRKAAGSWSAYQDLPMVYGVGFLRELVGTLSFVVDIGSMVAADLATLGLDIEFTNTGSNGAILYFCGYTLHCLAPNYGTNT